MRLNGFRCDECGKEYLVAKRAFQDNTLPDGWFTVGSGKYEGQEPLLFCSKDCVAEWASVKLFTHKLTAADSRTKAWTAESVPLSASPSDHTPHPYCCAEHYPLPERRKP